MDVAANNHWSWMTTVQPFGEVGSHLRCEESVGH